MSRSALFGVGSALKESARHAVRGYRRKRYELSGRIPWSSGYADFKRQFIGRALANERLLSMFEAGKPLNPGHGIGLDERVVELPWVTSRLGGASGRLLDAGSALNFDYVLDAAPVSRMKTTIATLAPEAHAYWDRGISYVFGDLRNLDFRDGWFDVVACVSTIEHVGMDNSVYAGQAAEGKRAGSAEHLKAIAEMKRVLRPGGTLLITFPFGERQDFGWFRQFDAEMTDELVRAFSPQSSKETVFRYTNTGWQLSDRDSAAGCRYSEETIAFFDRHGAGKYPKGTPAGAEAVICLELKK